MFYSYGISLQGIYHIKHNIVCQDYNKIYKCSESMSFSAIADGLGSEKYTDIASRIACESIIEYAKAKINESLSSNEIIQEIKNGFQFALDKINEDAKNNERNINEYDTTLVFCAFINDKIYYGYSGDSGLIALKTNGEYVPVTKQQRDENGYVYPLVYSNYWAFGEMSNVSSILMVTDGIWDALFPYLLHNEKVEIYVGLAQYLADPSVLNFEELGEEKVREKIETFLLSIDEKQVSDDKTVVCVSNSSIKNERMDESYYVTPDWTALKKKKDEEFKKLAYPHLFKDKSNLSDN